MSRPTAFFAALWLAIACCVAAGRIAHALLNGYPPNAVDILSDGAIYALWVPVVPLIVAISRRTRSIPAHIAAAFALSFANLVAHKLLFCGVLSGDYVACVTYYRFEAWMVRWLLLDAFVYAATASGIWLVDTREEIRRGDLLLSRKQRELASAELQIVHGQIPPAYLTSLFEAIASRLENERDEAEEMITKVADFLRASVSAIRAPEITVADDLALLTAWADVESARRSAPVMAMVEVGARARATPVGAPTIQPLAARLVPEGSALIRVTSSEQDDVVSVRVDCSNGLAETIVLPRRSAA